MPDDATGALHDINNLLGIVLNHAEFLSYDAGRRDEHDLAVIRQAAWSASALCRQMLMQGDDPAATSDVNELVRAAISLLRGLPMVAVDTSGLDPAVRPARADRTSLERIVVNLLMNATQAMPRGGVVRVETASDGGYVRLRIRDTGAGMAADVAARAFEPYFTTRPTGTGLGLATVRDLVTRAGGQVDLRSTPGVGTTVSVMLPADRWPSADL